MIKLKLLQDEFNLKERLTANETVTTQQNLSMELENHVRLAEIAFSASNISISRSRESTIDSSNAKRIKDIRPLTNSDRDSIEKYMSNFESFCKIYNIPDSQWSDFLIPKLPQELASIVATLPLKKLKVLTASKSAFRINFFLILLSIKQSFFL